MLKSSNASTLRSRIEDIDSQLLLILLPHAPLTREDFAKINTLEHARTATWRLLVAAELDETKNE